jgi:hypothetical protein
MRRKRHQDVAQPFDFLCLQVLAVAVGLTLTSVGAHAQAPAGDIESIVVEGTPYDTSATVRIR